MFQAVYYRDAAGNEPVDDANNRLDPGCQESIDWRIGLLNRLDDTNPELPMPYSSAIRTARYRAFRELRAECGKTHHRILYRRSRRLIVLLHAIIGKTEDIPEQDLKVAAARWDDFLARIDAPVRVPPRAAGHDAPGHRTSGTHRTGGT